MLNLKCHTRQNSSKTQFGNRRNPEVKSIPLTHLNVHTPGITHADTAINDGEDKLVS